MAAKVRKARNTGACWAFGVCHVLSVLSVGSGVGVVIRVHVVGDMVLRVTHGVCLPFWRRLRPRGSSDMT